MLKGQLLVALLAVVAILLSLYFGLTSLVTESSGRGLDTRHYTDWGRVALSLVFGIGGVGASLHLLRRK